MRSRHNGPQAGGTPIFDESSSSRDGSDAAKFSGITRLLGSPRAHRLAILFGIFLLPLSYLAVQAFWAADTSFLPPSLSATWALHPVQEILHPRRRPVSRDVLFETEFELKTAPTVLELRLRAFKEVEVLWVNGTPFLLTGSPNSWKSPRTVDVSGSLRAGSNRLEVRIHNDDGIPALLIEEPALLRTPGKWVASLLPNQGETRLPQRSEKRKVVPPSITGPPEPLDQMLGRDPPPFGKWMSQMKLSWLVLPWLVLAASVLVLASFRLRRKTAPVVLPARSRRLKHLAPALIAGLGLWLHFSNALHFPFRQSPFDLSQHVEYVRHLGENLQVPDPRNGFEMYQPPLYYLSSALLYHLAGKGDQAWKWVQCLGALTAWGLSLLTWLYARRMFPDRPAAHSLAFLFASFLPMTLYMSPLIGNEVFSATVIAAALFGLIVLFERPEMGWNQAAGAGALAGLAMLSKFTGLFTFLAGAAFLGQRAVVRRRREWRNLSLYVGSALLLCGWFYARNLLTFGDPFIGNWDEQSGFRYVQNPSYRSLGFYLRFGQVFLHHPERGPWLSFFDGQYASMWADVYRTFLSAGDDRSYSVVGLVLLLAAVPTASIIGGFLQTVSCVWRRPVNNTNLLLLAVTVWTLAAIVSFTIEVSFASTIKAFFFLSLVPVLGIYLIRGRALLGENSRVFRILHDAVLAVVAVLNAWLYCYRG